MQDKTDRRVEPECNISLLISIVQVLLMEIKEDNVYGQIKQKKS